MVGWQTANGVLTTAKACACRSRTPDGRWFRSSALPDGGGLAAWDDPEYHYSEELGAGLVRTRSVDYGFITYQHARITKVLTNKSVLESYVKIVPTGKDDGGVKEELSPNLLQLTENLTRAEFVKRAAAVMSK